MATAHDEALYPTGKQISSPQCGESLNRTERPKLQNKVQQKPEGYTNQTVRVQIL